MFETEVVPGGSLQPPGSPRAQTVSLDVCLHLMGSTHAFEPSFIFSLHLLSQVYHLAKGSMYVRISHVMFVSGLSQLGR